MCLFASFFLSALNLFAGDPGMFRGGGAHSGVYESESLPTLGSVKWTFRIGARVLSSPAFKDGVVYVGSADHHLYAVDAKDGSLRWSTPESRTWPQRPGASGGAMLGSTP